MSDSIDLQPLFARVVIERKETPDKVGSIYVPKNSKEMEPTEGTVVAVGDCEKVQVGDKVYFGRYSGFSFERYGKHLVFANEEDILAVIK